MRLMPTPQAIGVIEMFKAGIKVHVLQGKYAGQTGAVEHSDKFITSVRFAGAKFPEPVWTKFLKVAESR